MLFFYSFIIMNSRKEVIPLHLSDLIKSYRAEHGLSQRKFAQVCGLSNGYLSMLENGKNPRSDEPMSPSLSVLNSIAIGMGKTIDELIEACDDMMVSLRPDTPTILHESDQLLLDSYHNAPEEIRRAIDGLLEPYSPKKQSKEQYN